MILVDTSVWVKFLRNGDKNLSDLLEKGKVFIHEYIIGELSLGNIKNREEILELLYFLPRLDKVNFEELSDFIELKKLYGKCIGFVDVSILASSVLENIKIWTLDKKFNEVIEQFNLKY